ncbi:MAG TPA: YhdP family protein [Casimicrobiaceae bacterium]
MPSPESSSRPIACALRIALWTGIIIVGAFCVLLLGVRFVVLPQVESHRDDLARWLAARIGQPVSIASVTTGWNGWNPRLSIRGLRVGVATPEAPALLDLPRVDLVVAWTSLPLADLRLKELAIDSPRLFVRRDVRGRLHIAGVEVAGDETSGDSAVADWLLRQPQVVVHDALVVWNDDYRRAPQLILDHVDFRLDRRFGRVRIGLTGVPPSELAAPIDLRADLARGSLSSPGGIDGRVYVRLDYADLGAWAGWLPLPASVDRGEGALRMWLDVKASQPTRVIADVEVNDLRTVLDPALAPLALAHVSGRVTWTRNGDQQRARVEHLALTLPDGVAMASGRVDVAYDAATAGSAAHGHVEFDRVELAALAEIGAHLPLPARWRETVAALAPRGTLTDGKLDWAGDGAGADTVAGSVRFDDVSVVPQGAWPGFTRLAGSVAGDLDHGTLTIGGSHASIELPAVFAAPIALDSARGRIEWDRRDQPLKVTFDGVEFANADASGTAAGSWQDEGSGPGRAKLSAHLTRANVAAVWRYVPTSVPASVRAWLQRALTGGTATDATLSLDGDLAEFPFHAGTAGIFAVDVRTRDATLAYADDWPSLTGIDANVRFAGAGLTIDVARGDVLGARITRAHVAIRDLSTRSPLLSVSGAADGPTASFLDFIAKSPVAQWTDEVTASISARGDSRLALGVDLPLDTPEKATVDGTLSLDANALRIAGTPPIDALSGDVHFTQQGVDASGLSGRLLGGPATLTMHGHGDSVTLAASGSADLARLRDAFAFAWLDRVSGAAPWKLDARMRDGGLDWTSDVALKDARVDLPAPLAKPAGVAATLHIERRGDSPKSDRLTIDCTLADPLRVIVDRRDDGSGLRARRVRVALGGAAATAVDAPPDDPTGSSIRGTVATLDGDGWLALGRTGIPTGVDPALEITRFDVDAKTLVLAGRPFARTRIDAVRNGARWQVALRGSDLDGQVTWQPASATEPHGRMVARLARLALPRAPTGDTEHAQAAATVAERASSWPALDLEAKDFVSHGHPLGSLDLVAEPDEKNWSIRKLAVVNEHGRIDAHGLWRAAAADPTTTLDGGVDVKEAGEFMARFGWPNVIKGTPSKITGTITWKGSPADFDYASLSGAFALDAGAGRFTKIEPGVGRLLGVLSLQALPRRIALDFRDVFSAGFAFDKASGKVTMHDGIMHTDDLRLTGPSAVVDIAGDADLARETQKLRVKVEPALASGISAGAAALFLANPLVGAAVGAGTLLAQKLLNNPVDQLFSYEYLVSGSWDDPVVTRAGSRAAAKGEGATR